MVSQMYRWMDERMDSVNLIQFLWLVKWIDGWMDG